MKTKRKPAGSNMRKYYQLMLVIICFISVVTLLIYRHEYYRLRYVLEVLNFFGKPGLSEIEFCGPGFNATLLTEIMRNSSMEIRETPPLFQQIDENFYIYSSFARSFPNRNPDSYKKTTNKQGVFVDTIAIGRESEIPKFSCKIWVGVQNSHKPGKFSYKVIRKSVKGLTLYVFKCYLNEFLGRANGVSYYTNNYNLNPYHAPVSKLIKISDKHKKRKSSRIRFVNNIQPAICVIPNQVPIVTSDDLMTFIVFHYIIGVNYFTVYDSMVTNNIVKRLNLIPNDIKQWDLQLYPLNYPFMAQSYDILRHVIELDCLFRHFRLDKDSNNVSHVMVMSWDEFLVPRVHVDLKSVLDDYDPLRKVPSIEVSPLLFCENQADEVTNEQGYPVIFKKTHFYMLPHDFKSVFIYNLDTLTSFDDIFSIINLPSKKIPLDQIAMQKYAVCGIGRTLHGSGAGYNYTEMQKFPHKFEGAMLKFTQNLINDKVYRLYRESMIWDTNYKELNRDL